MPVLELPTTDSVRISDDLSADSWLPTSAMCDEWERRQDSEPAIFPSLLFTEDEVRSVNWDAVFAEW